MKKLTIVIVSYNVSAFLEKCLQSVYRSLENPDLAHILVVDNNSVDDSVAMVKSRFPQVELIENNKNLGFGVANNLALDRVETEFVLLLNPDTLLNEDTISCCLEFMEQHPEAGAVGVKMFDGSGNYLPESKRGFPTPGVALSKMLGLGKLFPGSKTFNGYYMGHLDPDEVNQVDVLTGAFMFVRMSVLNRVGFFDEDYFMYGEDIDLSYRIVKEGYPIYYLPSTSIIHYKGESTKKASLNYLLSFYNAMIIFLDKHFSGARYAPFTFLIKAGVYLRAAVGGLHRLVRFVLPILGDGLLIVGAVLAARYFWGALYFDDPRHFDLNFYRVNLPLYTGCLLFFLFLAGSYDKYYSLRRLSSGLISGTIAILIVYAMLTPPYRSSRAAILISVLLAFLLTSGLRYLMHFFQHKSFSLGTKRRKNAIVIGSEDECRRILELLNRSQANIRLTSKLSPVPLKDNSFFDNDISQLEAILQLYPVDELIFSARDMPFSEITSWMNRLGNNYEFKIASETSRQIVGSKSKDNLGELYSVDFEYHLAQHYYQRNKRIFDFLTALILLIMSPLLIAIVKSGGAFYRHCLAVLGGRMTWVGYNTLDPELSQLPELRKAIIPISPGLGDDIRGREIASIRNLLYAKEYAIWKDIEQLFRHWRLIGR